MPSPVEHVLQATEALLEGTLKLRNSRVDHVLEFTHRRLGGVPYGVNDFWQARLHGVLDLAPVVPRLVSHILHLALEVAPTLLELLFKDCRYVLAIILGDID